jgi:predicted signal transduction protein with EAL and GGDEF domain
VETVDQLRLVHELGCDLVQGYLISTPMPPAELKGWKKDFRRRWRELISGEELALWRNVKADALSER